MITLLACIIIGLIYAMLCADKLGQKGFWHFIWNALQMSVAIVLVIGLVRVFHTLSVGP